VPGLVISFLFGVVVLQVIYKPPVILSGWRSFAPANEHNELGFRGQRFVYAVDDFVIVLLGDSNVDATALPFESMPERLLEKHLNSRGKQVRVVSVAAGGYGQDQQLLALGEFFGKYRAQSQSETDLSA
jgi:hypothetical protein